jgi:predicted glycosyltransferase
VIDVPLVAIRSTRAKADILRQLELDLAEKRPRVLVALRGGVDETALLAAARCVPDLLLLHSQELSVGVASPPNLRRVQWQSGLDFADLLAVSKVVISKLGYGTLAESIAAGTAVLWPPRVGFREDQVTQRQAPQYLRMREISRDDFLAGRWAGDLHRLLAMPAPPSQIGTDGAEVCARLILDHL